MLIGKKPFSFNCFNLFLIIVNSKGLSFQFYSILMSIKLFLDVNNLKVVIIIVIFQLHRGQLSPNIVH